MTNYNECAPYPFQYPTANGFKWAGFEHSTGCTIAEYLKRCANSYAREILFDEKAAPSVYEIIQTVKQYTGIALDSYEVRIQFDDALGWYTDNNTITQPMHFNI